MCINRSVDDDPSPLTLYMYIDDDFDGLGDDAIDVKGLSKRDMHTLNEQRRRDSIKVHTPTCTCTHHIPYPPENKPPSFQQ